MKRRMVFDVESVGLHGEAFAVGYLVLLGDSVLSEAWAYCPPSKAKGTQEGRDWVAQNCPWAEKGMSAKTREENEILPGIRKLTPAELANWFWQSWLIEKSQGAQLWADVSWPVEARFLTLAVESDRPINLSSYLEPSPSTQLLKSGREWEGPYPLFDVASLMESLTLMGHQMVVEDNDPSLLIHHPLIDARISAQKILHVERFLGGETVKQIMRK